MFKRIYVLAAATVLFYIFTGEHRAQDRVEIGPENGTLVIAGGGRLDSTIIDTFIGLAGGKDAHIVVIPTAGGRDNYDGKYRGLNLFRTRGAKNLSVLHTYDPKKADTKEFVQPLKKAGGVWFSGGRQWRLTDAYLNTRTQTELFNVLKRGGVIGGSSAGASVQATYMVRGAPEGNRIMMAKGHEDGLGFIKGVAIDQHLETRNRFVDLIGVIEAYPELLGIGLYESTAIVVQKDCFKVIGKGKVAVYDNRRITGPNQPFYFLLNRGDRYNLKFRTVVRKLR